MPSTTRAPSAMAPAGKPALAPHVRLAYDKARGKSVLLAPESVTTLNETAAAIAELCDGTRSVAQIAAELRERYADVDVAEVESFVELLASLRCLRREQPEEGG